MPLSTDATMVDLWSKLTVRSLEKSLLEFELLPNMLDGSKSVIEKFSNFVKDAQFRIETSNPPSTNHLMNLVKVSDVISRYTTSKDSSYLTTANYLMESGATL